MSQDGQILDLGEDQEALETILPKQWPDQDLAAKIGEGAKSVQQLTTAVMAANIVITLVLSVSLKAMWNMVHVL